MMKLRWDEAVPTEEQIETAEPRLMRRQIVGDVLNHKLCYVATWLEGSDRRTVTMWNERPNVFGIICTSSVYGSTSTWGTEERCMDLAGRWAGWRGISKEVL
jgi:hypothetical protein